MKTYKVLEIKQSVFENNDRQADLLREELKKDVFKTMKLIFNMALTSVIKPKI